MAKMAERSGYSMIWVETAAYLVAIHQIMEIKYLSGSGLGRMGLARLVGRH
jgi:hypothetical protein